MQFEISKEVLLEGLNKVTRVITTKNVIPILQGILIEVTEQEIILTGSDSIETIIYYIPVDGQDVVVTKVGKVVFPRNLIEIVKKSSKKLNFNVNELVTTIKFGRSKFEINCMNGEEYPRIPQINIDKPSLTLDGKQFSDLVKRTAFAASDNEIRPILQGVQCLVEDNFIRLVSTDAHRLAQVKMDISNSKNINLVFPAKALENAVKIFDERQEIHIYTDYQMLVFFRNGQTVFSTRLLEGTYPETARLIPTDYKTIMRINRKEFINALELIKGISDNDQSAVAKLHINGAASLSSYNPTSGHGNVEISYENLEGEDDLTISFSIKYVLDALKVLESEQVDMNFQGPFQPFTVLPAEKESIDELQLILPVRSY